MFLSVHFQIILDWIKDFHRFEKQLLPLFSTLKSSLKFQKKFSGSKADFVFFCYKISDKNSYNSYEICVYLISAERYAVLN